MIEAVLLGAAQDAGVPQMGCDCTNCNQARRHPDHRQLAISLGLIDHATRQYWLIDATPDFREQYDWLRARVAGYAFAGICLTHAHIGHYTGLVHLGKEAMNTRSLPVYATPALCAFLSAHAPWSQLVQLGNVALHPVKPVRWQHVVPSTQRTLLSTGLRLLPISVPHRAEFSDTIAYLIETETARLLHLPDIDTWDAWTDDLRATLAALQVDVALLDGSFFSPGELPRMAQVPHPLVIDTAERLHRPNCEVVMVHLNHTNPLWQNGPQRAWLTERGLRVGAMGDVWML